MAQKILNTKIREAYDTEANWMKYNPVLLAGQLAFSSDKYGKYKVGNGNSKWSELPYNTLNWTDITGKPSSFTPSSHTHVISQITDIKNASVNYATTAGAVPWSGVSGKPSTFTPSSHSHTIANITNLQSALDRKASVSHNHDTIYAKSSHSHSSIHDCNSGSSIGISSTLGIVPSVSEKYDIVVTNTSEHGNKFVTLDKTIFANYLIDTIPLKAITNTQIDSLASL